MSRQYVRDMTTGNIARHLIAFAIPMLAGNLFQQFYNMVDSIVVGRFVGTIALGAVGSVGAVCFLCFSVCLGMANGIGILVSQYFGAGEEHMVKKCISQAVYVTGISGLIMSFVGGFFAEKILVLMDTPAENFADALIYMRIVVGLQIFVAIYNSASAILRALGDSKTPLYFLIASSIINIILDFVFVLFFNMEVAGVAIATVLSQLVAAVGAVVWGVKTNPYLRIDLEDFKPDIAIISREVRMGIPLAIQSATIAISCVVLQRVVNGFGPMVMAASTASNRIEQLVQQPFNSLGVSLSTFAGQNYGAKNSDRIMKSSRDGIIIVAIFSCLMIAVMNLFAEGIVGIFIKDAAVIEIGARGLKLTSFMYVFLGAIYVYRGVLNGVGDVGFSMLNGITEVIGRIGFAVLLISVFKMDYMAIWYTNGFTWTITAIMSVFRFHLGGWRKPIMYTYSEA